MITAVPVTSKKKGRPAAALGRKRIAGDDGVVRAEQMRRCDLAALRQARHHFASWAYAKLWIRTGSVAQFWNHIRSSAFHS